MSRETGSRNPSDARRSTDDRRPPETRSNAAPQKSAAPRERDPQESDYLKKGKGGGRNFGFLIVLAVHWLLIGGLIYGMTKPKSEDQPPPIVLTDVKPDPQPQPTPIPLPPEPPTLPVEVWVPVPQIPGVETAPDSSAPQGSPSATPSSPDVPVRLDPRFPPSKPDYPASSKRLGQEGVVTLLLLVGPDGRVIEAKVERGSGYPALDEAAVRGARAWRFKPAESGGKTVSAWYRTSVRFELENA